MYYKSIKNDMENGESIIVLLNVMLVYYKSNKPFPYKL